MYDWAAANDTYCAFCLWNDYQPLKQKQSYIYLFSLTVSSLKLRLSIVSTTLNNYNCLYPTNAAGATRVKDKLLLMEKQWKCEYPVL